TPFRRTGKIAVERGDPPQTARIVLVAPEVGDLVALDRGRHCDLPLVVEYLSCPGLGDRIFGLAGQLRFGLRVPLLDLLKRAFALDLLKPDVGIVRHRILCGERGGQREEGESES